MAKDTIGMTAQADVEPAPIRIDKELGVRIVQSFRAAYDQALSDRSGIDEGVLIAERNWEMITIERTFPWKGASNVFIPIIPEQVINVIAATKADVFTPGGFFLLIGENSDAAMKAHDVQRYYNAKLTERQGLGYRTWQQEAEDFLGLAALHGTSYLDVTYLRKTSKRRYIAYEDDPSGALDADGMPEQIATPYVVDFTEYDGVLWEALELRDVVLVPARAKSLQDARRTGAVVRIMHLTEDELMQMSAPVTRDKPILDREAVLELIKSTISGGSERMQDPRGMETYENGGIVQATTQPFTDDVDGRLMVTEYEVLRVESSAVDVNNDGVGEHMIYFIHRQPEILLGSMVFPYHHDQCLTVDLSLMRRYKRAYGFGVPDRLRTIQTEYNANFNMGNDQSNLRLAPPRFQEEGVKILGTDNGEWGPNVTFIGSAGAVGILELPDIIPSNAEIRSELGAMAMRMSNQSTGSGARMTKAAIQMAQAKQNAYQNTMSENLRYSLADALYLTMELDKQFGPKEMVATVMPQGRGGAPQQVTIQKEDIMLPYQQLITGMGGPQDPAQDRNDRMTLHQMFSARPDYANDPERLYKLDEWLLESFPMADKQMLIGTPDDAQKRGQAQQQAAAEKQKQADQMLQAEIVNKTKGQGLPPDPAQQPPGGQPPGGGMPPGGGAPPNLGAQDGQPPTQ
jgi:hypothetical protein